MESLTQNLTSNMYFSLISNAMLANCLSMISCQNIFSCGALLVDHDGRLKLVLAKTEALKHLFA